MHVDMFASTANGLVGRRDELSLVHGRAEACASEETGQSESCTLLVDGTRVSERRRAPKVRPAERTRLAGWHWRPRQREIPLPQHDSNSRTVAESSLRRAGATSTRDACAPQSAAAALTLWHSEVHDTHERICVSVTRSLRMLPFALTPTGPWRESEFLLLRKG